MLKKMVVGEEVNGGWMWANCGVGSRRIWEECSHAVSSNKQASSRSSERLYSPPKIALKLYRQNTAASGMTRGYPLHLGGLRIVFRYIYIYI